MGDHIKLVIKLFHTHRKKNTYYEKKFMISFKKFILYFELHIQGKKTNFSSY